MVSYDSPHSDMKSDWTRLSPVFDCVAGKDGEASKMKSGMIPLSCPYLSPGLASKCRLEANHLDPVIARSHQSLDKRSNAGQQYRNHDGSELQTPRSQGVINTQPSTTTSLDLDLSHRPHPSPAQPPLPAKIHI